VGFLFRSTEGELSVDAGLCRNIRLEAGKSYAQPLKKTCRKSLENCRGRRNFLAVSIE
jgi:hypothetical protein